MPDTIDYAGLFAEHRRRLWGLTYRMTGSTSEAEDLVQETFARALERPPADRERPWGPWLVTVATRLAIDAFRRRQQRGYTGSFLPAPLDADTMAGLLPPVDAGADRYETLDSLSFGFMLALETLSATQRAVLVLRDALGFSGPETAAMLELSPENVRTTLGRARRVMAEHRRAAKLPDPLHHTRALALLQRFMQAAAAGDVDALVACLAEDARLVADGGGRYVSPLQPVTGADRIARFVLGIAAKATDFATAWTELNGEPAVLVCVGGSTVRRAPPRTAFRIELDAEGSRIAEVHLMSNPDKIEHLPFPPSRGAS